MKNPIKKLVANIRFSVRYDLSRMAERNEKKYGNDVPDCCRVNRQENEARK